jgi:hypothetical protein
MTAKQCSSCGILKQSEDFYSTSTNKCKNCVKDRVSKVKAAKKLGLKPEKSNQELARDVRNSLKSKICLKCKVDLPTSCFYKHGTGLQNECKNCICSTATDKRAAERVPTENEILLLSSLRKCSTCQSIQDLGNFYKKREDGYDGKCKTCKSTYDSNRFKDNPSLKETYRQRRKEYLLNNPEAALAEIAYRARYYQDNKEEHNAWCKAWFKRNPGAQYKYYRKWRLNNLDVSCFHANKRRVAKLQATPSWAKSEEEAIKEFYKDAAQMN